MTGKMVTFSMDGLRELENALQELPEATARNNGRKALRAGATPILDDYVSRAPRLTGRMVESANIGTKLSRRQRAAHRKVDDRDNVEMFVGPGPDPAAVQNEFGNEHQAAQPALIPAFENNKRRAIDIIGDELGKQIAASTKRLARKLAKGG